MTIKGTNLADKTDHPDAGAYNSGLTDYIWADDWNDLAETVNNMWSGVFTEGLDVTGDINHIGSNALDLNWITTGGYTGQMYFKYNSQDTWGLVVNDLQILKFKYSGELLEIGWRTNNVVDILGHLDVGAGIDVTGLGAFLGNNIILNTPSATAILPDAFSTTTPTFIEVLSETIGTDVGIFLRRSDEATGLDIWTDCNTGQSYIDNLWSTNGINFRVNTLGTPFTRLVLNTVGSYITGNLDVTGNITLGGTVDGVDIADRDHAPTVAGDLAHNSLTGLNDGTSYEHLTSTQVSALHPVVTDLDHNALTNYVANEHIDWTIDQGATNIHAGNYTNTTYVSSDFTHNSLSGLNDGTSYEHLTATQVTALHDIYVLTKSNVDALAITTVGTVTSGNIDTIANYIPNTDAIASVSSKVSGDIFYWTTSLQRLAKGSDGQVLVLASGVPTWVTGGSVYSDADAILAVEGEATLDLTGAVTHVDTNIGRVGSTGLFWDSAYPSKTDWADLPLGFRAMTRSTYSSTSYGSPLTNKYGHILKIANRDAASGYTMLWVQHDDANYSYIGSATDGVNNYATWRRLITDNNYSSILNSSNWDTAYGWGNHASGGYSTGSHTVAGDLAHNSLTGLNDGTSYEHLTSTQVSGLHTSHSHPTSVTGMTLVEMTTTSSRDKFRVYPSYEYAIGMQSAIQYGGLSDWAMTFQFSNASARGFWWGDVGHSTSQGAMALTTDGRLTTARGMRVGFGESDTSLPSNTNFQCGGSVTAISIIGDSPTSTAGAFYSSRTGSYDPVVQIRNEHTTDTNNAVIRVDIQKSSTAGSGNKWIMFFRAGQIKGQIDSEVVYRAFTGGHNGGTPVNPNIIINTWRPGMILSSIGTLSNPAEASIGNALPKVRLSNGANDKKVIGVYSERIPEHPPEKLIDHVLNDEQTEWYYNNSDPETKTKCDELHSDHAFDRDVIQYNALGEGMLLITDDDGDIQNGDLVTTHATIKGLGTLQADDLMHSYTVAKITIDTDWSSVDIDAEFGVKVALVGCTYHCG